MITLSRFIIKMKIKVETSSEGNLQHSRRGVVTVEVVLGR